MEISCWSGSQEANLLSGVEHLFILVSSSKTMNQSMPEYAE